MPRARSSLTKADVARIADLLNATGTKIVTVKAEPNCITITTNKADGEEIGQEELARRAAEARAKNRVGQYGRRRKGQ
jgi:hypothetical protein